MLKFISSRFHLQASVTKFQREARSVDRLQQPGSEDLVDPDSALDDLPGQLLVARDVSIHGQRESKDHDPANSE